MTFWSGPLETLLAGLSARLEGLSSADADRRRATSGANRAGVPRGRPPWRLLLDQFRSPLVLLLLFAMTLSLFLGETTDGVIVLVVVAVFWLLPVLGLLVASLRPEEAGARSGWWTVFTAPAQLTLANYAALLSDRVMLGSLWNTVPASDPRSLAAARRASSTSPVRMWSAICQPASLREPRSMQVAR